MQKLTYRIQVPVSIMRQGKRYIAYTPALDLSTSGKSEEEAKKRFEELVPIFFEELIEAGTLAEVLKGYGWQKVQRQWKSPKIVSQEAFGFRIPVAA